MSGTLGHMSGDSRPYVWEPRHTSVNASHMTGTFGDISGTLGHTSRTRGHMSRTVDHMSGTLGHIGTLGHMFRADAPAISPEGWATCP